MKSTPHDDRMTQTESTFLERELRLKEQIRQQAEELALTMSQMGKHISYYDIATSTMTTSPMTAAKLGVPSVIENYPECHIENPPPGYSRADAEKLRPFFEAIRRGEPRGSYDYSATMPDGQKLWLHREFNTIFNDQGDPVRAVLTSEDVTEKYEQEQRQKVDRAGLIKVTQLVFPEIFSCNLTRGTCDVAQSAQETSGDIPLEIFLLARLEDVALEDQEAFRRQFFPEHQLAAMAKGRERFQLTYRKRSSDDRWHWFETIALRQDNPYNDEILTFVVSRSVDEQKAQEERLRQALADSTDKFEGWHYYNRLTHQNYGGLTYVHYPDGRPTPYTVGTLAQRLDCPVKELVLGTCFRIPQEDRGLLQQAFEEARQTGKKCFQADYRVETDRGELVWIHNYAAEFTDKQGETGYIYFLSDTTQEHLLMEQLQAHLEERLKKSEQVFDIVAQHSNRILYQYDLTERTTSPWNKESAARDILHHLYSGVYSDEALEENPFILPESIEATKRFFGEIHSGVPSGQLNIHIKLLDGQLRWYHFQYSSFFDGDKPVTALISIEDITERHEHEIAHLRHTLSVVDNTEENLLYLEGCLVCDRVEKLSGQMLSQEERAAQCAFSEVQDLILQPKFQFTEPEKAAHYFSQDHLLALYAQGERKTYSEWSVRFCDGTAHWLGAEVVLMADPFNDHVKVFIRMEDITEDQEEWYDLHQRADYDAMTGLLRRGVGERKIREYLSARHSPGGVLLVLDLDDLKGINDTLGHAYGDTAIAGIAETIKGHFRKDDILIRAGGDEFMVFLPGAGKNADSVALSAENLLRKLSGVFVDEHGERPLRCSIGCAVELPDTDTFDSLYQRADMALYHVKRHGKNSYAFYEPAMLEESYRFKVKQATPVMNSIASEQDLKDLLRVVAAHYPGIVLFNLTRNQFRILTTGSNVKVVHASDTVEAFWENWRKNIHPDDQENTLEAMSRSRLLALYTQGKRGIRRYYRNLESVSYVRTEVAIQLYATDAGDICAYLFFRWDNSAQPEEDSRGLEDALFYCLNTLTREGKLEAAAHKFLQAVGGYYEANRAYIIEFDLERQTSYNTFEWCAPGVSAEIDNLQDIPLSVMDHWIEKFETIGEFSISSLDRDLDPNREDYRILQAQGIQSLLAAPLRHDGQIVGFVGVDDPTIHGDDLSLLQAVSGFVLEELEKHRLMAELERRSSLDVLTGLHNRNQYARILQEFESTPPAALGMVALDINGMREINDTHGLAYGDHVLKHTADILQELFPGSVYRIGGDEFKVLCTDITREDFQNQVVKLKHTFDTDKTCEVSIGFAWTSDEDSIDVEALRHQVHEMRCADKQSYYHTALSEGHTVSHTGLASEVLQEIEDDRFVVHYQPQVDIKTGTVVGAEALVRKKGEDGSLIPPGKFIPFYEVGGVISHVDLFVMRTACAALRTWLDQGLDLHISVNFSRMTLLEPYIVDTISGICAETRVPPSSVTIEVTESIGKMDSEYLERLIEKLKAAGFSISLDDFGSQYSNLAILAAMDFDEVKFDRSLISTLEENEKSRLVMESGLGLCRALEGTSSLAEGIETKGQLDLLADYHCDYGQGYYFSRPIPLEEFQRFVTEHLP